MVIAVWAVLVALLKLLAVLAEALLALLAGEDHLERLEKGVRLLLLVAFGAVKPLPTCIPPVRTDREELLGSNELARDMCGFERYIQHGERIAT